MADEPQTLDMPTTDLTPKAVYALSIDPLSTSLAQVAALLMVFGFVIPQTVYDNLPVNLKSLFRYIDNAPVQNPQA